MRRQVDTWKESQLTETTAKLIIYRAFIESYLEVPKHLARPVHDSTLGGCRSSSLEHKEALHRRARSKLWSWVAGQLFRAARRAWGKALVDASGVWFVRARAALRYQLTACASSFGKPPRPLAYTAAAMVEPVIIDPVAPALFAANATGKGVAAAVAVSVNKSNSAQTPVTVFHCDPLAGCSPVPIALSADAQVYVSLYGTGIRGAGGASKVTCTVHGVGVPVQYAGPQRVFLGLDQVNVALPLSLKGSGQSEVILTAGGHASNTVLLNIQ